MRIKLTGIRSSRYLYSGTSAWLTKKGEIEQAIENIEKALSILEIKVGGKHPNYALILNNLGSVSKTKATFKKPLNFSRKLWEFSWRFSEKTMIKHP